MSVGSSQRYTRSHPCPICAGHEHMPRGHGERCTGFLSNGGDYARCTREEHAGTLKLDEKTTPPTYLHRLTGDCRCGKQHGAAGPSANGQRPRGSKLGREVAAYDYCDTEGNLLYQNVRFADPKDFRMRRPDGKGDWAWNMTGIQRVLYRLPELGKAVWEKPDRWIFLTEGEKDVDRLRAGGLVGTCYAGGAKAQFKAEFAESLRECNVAVLWDYDKDGARRRDRDVAALHGIAAEVRIIDLPGLELADDHGDDISDWLDAGHDINELKKLVAATPPWEPPSESEEDDDDEPASSETEQFFSDGGFVPARLGRHLNDECRIRLGPDGRLYRYLDGVYRGDGEGWSRQRTRDLLGDRCRRRHLDEVLTWLRADLSSIPTQPDIRFLNLPNGLLDWRKGTLEAHSPETVSAIRVPIAWNPAATCSAVDRFLKEVLPEDAFDFVIEVIGYTLLPANPLQKAVLLKGPGGNGKGTLLQLIRALCGPDNVAARTLHALAEDRFAVADLFGRLANICGDLDARTVERSDIFKMVTGGDPITGERKYAHPFTFVAFATLIFSANEAPPTADQTQAYFDRWLVVPMIRRFRNTPLEDPRLLTKLTTPTELEGLLQRAVPGLRRLMDRGRFDVPQSVRKENERMQTELDTVLAFADECCELDLTRWTNRRTLYEAYTEWCDDNGRRPLGSRHVYAKLLERFSTLVERIHQGFPGFMGIAIRGEKGEKGDDSPNPSSRARGYGERKPSPFSPPSPAGRCPHCGTVDDWELTSSNNRRCMSCGGEWKP